VAWMCCDPLPPVPLGQKLIMTIGRSDASDLTLPHKEVSRRHAVIKVLGKTMVLEDEGSSNGVYLNGKRAASTLLKVGDTFSIGPYEIEIRSTEQMVDHDRETSTKSMELTSVSRMNPGAALTGRLAEVPVVELLQQLEFNKKTGTLDINHGDHHGQLVVANGLPVWAAYDDLSDDEAVITMAQLKDGRFSFSANVEPGDKTMSSRITGLLFEASRRMDEVGASEAEASLTDSGIGEALAQMDDEDGPRPEAKTVVRSVEDLAAHGIPVKSSTPEVEGFADASEDTDIAEISGDPTSDGDDGLEFSDSAAGNDDDWLEADELAKGPDESDHTWDISGSS